MDKTTLFWFRRDLRIDDNHALFKALSENKNVQPIFIFDKNILDQLDKDDARVTFIHQQLTAINNLLQKKGSSLVIHNNTPLQVFKELVKKHDIKNVYTNKDYEPYGVQRDEEIAAFLKTQNISFYKHKDHVIFEENEIVKKDGTPYKVYTPFSKKWMEALHTKHTVTYPSQDYLNNLSKNKTTNFLSLSEINFTATKIKIPEYNINQHLINSYEAKRNFPAIKGTSKLGHHLRFGTISIRKAVNEAQKSNNITFLKELIWREFFMNILWHFPNTITNSFKPKYDRIAWRNNKLEFEQWCKGNTGYPLVDAGMRELNATGFMHNRVRMLVGSFLCKHLLIDWRWGEAYFAKKLLDFELSSNIGNWQWVAGCGVDAAPYFRIFNPTTQVLKFDKELKYIKHWVPEFQELTYPAPIIEHKFARERCLEIYKKALN